MFVLVDFEIFFKVIFNYEIELNLFFIIWVDLMVVFVIDFWDVFDFNCLKEM